MGLARYALKASAGPTLPMAACRHVLDASVGEDCTRIEERASDGEKSEIGEISRERNLRGAAKAQKGGS